MFGPVKLVMSLGKEGVWGQDTRLGPYGTSSREGQNMVEGRLTSMRIVKPITRTALKEKKLYYCQIGVTFLER